METNRPDVRSGYDTWSASYDETPNPVVALDARVTPAVVRPRPEERILDAGCGTGRHFMALGQNGSRVIGLDFSAGMLRVAQRRHPDVPLVLGDLAGTWPFRDASFDAILCALVGEHLSDLGSVCMEMRRLLRPGGRVLFSVYHPAMAAAGKEANFQKDGIEYRLGAVRHTAADYTNAFSQAGFTSIQSSEYSGDTALVAAVPGTERFIGFPVLLVLECR